MNKQTEYFQNKIDFEMDPCDLFNAVEKGEGYIPLDTRKPAAFEKEHIPGSININHRDMNETITSGLDKSKTYVCYCKGYGCNSSTRGALNMSKLGFRVKELFGGLESWKNDGYSTEGTNSFQGVKMKCLC